jgi:hypothetical protein
MSTPTTFASGIATFPSNHVLAPFPNVPTQWQVVKGDDFIPFRSGDYTATQSGTGAAAAAFAWNGGMLRLTSGSTSTFKSIQAFPTAFAQFTPGNMIWKDLRLAMPSGTQTNPGNDTAVYSGFFDNVDPTAATNGLYFFKPSGGTAVHFIVLKNSVTTTFQNVADLAQPSGLFADPNGVVGLLTANTSGTTLTSLVVTTPGFGYRAAPLVVVNGTAGAGAQASVQLGGSAGFPQVSSQGAGSSLYAPYILAAGAGYTAGTFTLDIIPFINLQFMYDGKGRIMIGVNGRMVLALDKFAQLTAVPGQTYNTATVGRAFNFSGTTLTAGVAAVQPPVGDPIVAIPLVQMTLAFGVVGTTANNRVLYVEELNVATELN